MSVNLSISRCVMRPGLTVIFAAKRSQMHPTFWGLAQKKILLTYSLLIVMPLKYTTKLFVYVFSDHSLLNSSNYSHYLKRIIYLLDKTL